MCRVSVRPPHLSTTIRVGRRWKWQQHQKPVALKQRSLIQPYTLQHEPPSVRGLRLRMRTEVNGNKTSGYSTLNLQQELHTTQSTSLCLAQKVGRTAAAPSSDDDGQSATHSFLHSSAAAVLSDPLPATPSDASLSFCSPLFIISLRPSSDHLRTLVSRNRNGKSCHLAATFSSLLPQRRSMRSH